MSDDGGGFDANTEDPRMQSSYTMMTVMVLLGSLAWNVWMLICMLKCTQEKVKECFCIPVERSVGEILLHFYRHLGR